MLFSKLIFNLIFFCRQVEDRQQTEKMKKSHEENKSLEENAAAAARGAAKDEDVAKSGAAEKATAHSVVNTMEIDERAHGSSRSAALALDTVGRHSCLWSTPAHFFNALATRCEVHPHSVVGSLDLGIKSGASRKLKTPAQAGKELAELRNQASEGAVVLKL